MKLVSYFAGYWPIKVLRCFNLINDFNFILIKYHGVGNRFQKIIVR